MWLISNGEATEPTAMAAFGLCAAVRAKEVSTRVLVRVWGLGTVVHRLVAWSRNLFLSLSHAFGTLQ